MTFDLTALLSLDRSSVSTWHSITAALGEAAADPVTLLSLLDGVAADAWRSARDSDYYLHAAALLCRLGRIDGALALVRDAHRYGYPRFHQLGPGWGQPLFDCPPIAAFVAAHLQPNARGPAPGIHHTPLCWGESAILERRPTRCAVTNRRIATGDAVYRFRLWNGARDIPSDFLHAAEAAFASSEEAAANRRRYQSDSQPIASFAFHVDYHHPLVNAFWRDVASFDLGAALALITRAPATAAAFPLVDVDDDARRTFAGSGGELVDLLWVLVKCGHLPAIVARLPELPRDFALLLLLFDRPALRTEIALRLGLPQLPSIYELLGRARLADEERAALVRFGRDNPAFQELLAASLGRYEYHLESSYRHSPNWFFQDFGYLGGGHGARLLYLLASRPELLDSLRRMRQARAIPPLGVTSRTVAYDLAREVMVEVLLIHAALSGDREAVAGWSEQCDTARDAAKFQRRRRDALAVAQLLGREAG